MSYFVGNKEYFPGIPAIPFEGRNSKNPLSFKFYDKNKVVAGKTMQEHLRFAVCYWHTFCATGSDPFGSATRIFPWETSSNAIENAKNKLDAAFEFVTKLGAPYYCFHDRDIAPEGESVAESEKNLQLLTGLAKERQAATGVKLLWGTANLFSHKRYMNGASTNRSGWRNGRLRSSTAFSTLKTPVVAPIASANAPNANTVTSLRLR